MADAMYDESEPTTAESDELASTTSEEQSVANDTNDTKRDKKDKKDDTESDETEDQLALVPTHFFKDKPKPGDREMVEVIEVYEGEVSVKCVYGDKDDKDDDKEEESDGDDEGATESEPEDAAYE